MTDTRQELENFIGEASGSEICDRICRAEADYIGQLRQRQIFGVENKRLGVEIAKWHRIVAEEGENARALFVKMETLQDENKRLKVRLLVCIRASHNGISSSFDELMKKLGRPTKKNPEVVKQIVKMMEHGHSLTVACDFAGISRDSASRWQKRDKDFAAGITKARASGKAFVVGKLIENIGKGNQYAIQYWLDRRGGEDWRQIQFIEENQRPITILTYESTPNRATSGDLKTSS